MYRPGDVVLATLQFVDLSGLKKRPAVVLFGEAGNVVVAGITSNTRMRGVTLTRAEGAVADSVIKLNYVFTISEHLISKTLFRLSAEKKKAVYNGFVRRLEGLST